MKTITFIAMAMVLCAACSSNKTETTAEAESVAENPESKKTLFLDVHNLEPGGVTFEAVADAHKKDLATQGKFNVNFIKYWVDEELGKVYCLAEATDSASVYHTHKEAHGLVPDLVHQVTEGEEAAMGDNANLYFDLHKMGPGKVTAAAVADAHVKDLAVQDKFNVKFINYWVDEKMGVVMCLAESPDEKSMTDTHREAHGLIPDEVHKVQQGN